MVKRHEYIELSTFDKDQGNHDFNHNGDPVDHDDSDDRLDDNHDLKIGSNDNQLSSNELKLVLLRLGVISDDEYGNINCEDVYIPKQARFMIEKIENLSISDSISIIREALVEHLGDVNFLNEDYCLLETLINNIPESEAKISNIDPLPNYKNKTYLQLINWHLQIRLEASLIRYHSPYPEIRAITDPYDDPTIPVETLRVYVIGIFWTIVGAIINNFFVHRMPSIRLSSHTVQILLLPCGKLWQRYMPKKVLRLGRYSFQLNPGPWTYKEMMLTTIMYSCSAGTPYSIYNIFVMKLDRFYGLKWVGFSYQLILSLSTQFLGFGFAMVMKKVCVYPAKALWPTILPTIALNRALLNEEEINNHVYGWKISRYSFFCIVCIASFVYNIIPSYFLTSISNLNWPTWFNINLIHLANVTGSNNGLGLNPFPSLDWNILDSSNCLAIPFFTYVNQYIGSIIAFVVILIVYYTNNKWTGYIPINSNRLFDNKGEVYDVRKILNEKRFFDNDRYQNYLPPYFSAANLVLYGAYFALYPFAILYHFITEWTSIKSSFKSIGEAFLDSFKFEKDPHYLRNNTDPHCEMMSQYDEVPDWWFMMILLTSTALALAGVIFFPVDTPVWGIFFTIGINFFFLIPLTSIASVTGFSFGLNVLVELIVGYSIPNSGLALITLKAYGYNIDSQASNYITDQKLAHYAKVPPKSIFKCQILSTFISVFVALFIANWQIENVEDICAPHQRDKLSCPGATTYFYSSIQYGEIGPAKVFSGLYPILKWCFLLGVILVFPCIWFKKHGPRIVKRYFNPTIVIGGFLVFAPYNLLYFTGGLYLSYIFMYYIKGNYLLWWEKYNYILTSALSAGVAFSAIILFFVIQATGYPNWWGNRLNQLGIEGTSGVLWLNATLAPDGYFGLRKGQFP
jgi:OPT family small oligopeptide transporter